MLRIVAVGLAALSVATSSLSAGSKLRARSEPRYQLRDGDIVFQGNAGPQGDAVRAATGSPFTHCGIVFKKGDELMVIEAIQPVQVTPLDRFIARGLPDSFRAMRLKQPLDPAALAKGRAWAAKQTGISYDFHFRWDDSELYCSEFVWKAYHEAGVRICEPRKFRSYHLDDPSVRKVVNQRYGGMDKLPLDEPAVSPGDLAESKLLVEVPRSAGPGNR